ncbi:MAG: site-specific integrase [Pseudomonadales bacterium]|nr:site-specific integrase [Pseudomonadales bacterium]NRA17180.1 tyrosine-type recombinase/integrase [Oceanospirillaceae bacterium]
MAKYITKRGKHYHFVMGIPADLRDFYGKRRVQVSLKTTSLDIAEHQGLYLHDDLTEEFTKRRKEIRRFDPNREEIIFRMLHGKRQHPDKRLPSKLVEKFINEHRCNWADKTLLNYQQALRYFCDYLEHTPVDQITRKQCSVFKDMLLLIPRNRSNSESRLPLKVILKQIKGREPISRKRVNMLLECISAFMKWAVVNGHAKNNPLDGLKVIVPKRQQSRQKRRSWTTEELNQLFNSPLYTGCKHERRRSEPGDLIIKDHLYWLPILALYTGARAEELCQLRKEDIKIADGIYYLDIKEEINIKGELTQRLKNQSSKRQVPLHHLILELGFVSWIEKHQHPMLFAIESIGADKKWSSAFSRVFGRYKRAIGIDDAGVVFHSFRHCFLNQFKQANADQSLVRQLVGHTEQSLSLGRYTEKYHINKALTAINTIKYRIELETNE